MTKLEMDSFPCILENPSDFRKGSGDYGVTLAVQVKHVDQIQPLMAKAQKPFAAFLVPMTSLDHAETFIKAQDNSPQSPLSLRGGAEGGGVTEGPGLATVEQLALALAVDPRTIQHYADAGMLVRRATGQYDLLASLAAMNKARKDADTAQGDALRSERVLITQAKRISAQIDNMERAKKLGKCDECIKVRILKNADIKQRILSFEKVLPQKTGGRTAEEQVPIIRNETRKLLTDLAAVQEPMGSDQPGGQDLPAPAGTDHKPVGRRKAKAQRKNKRASR